jgi:hypothetical protein
MPETDTSHACPGPSCTRRVPRHQFACPHDWGRLPAELRREINATYRRDWPAWTAAATDAIAWYREHTAVTS